MNGQQRGDNLTIFRGWPFFICGNPQPDSKIIGLTGSDEKRTLTGMCTSFCPIFKFMSTTEVVAICGSLTGNMMNTRSETIPTEAKTCVRR